MLPIRQTLNALPTSALNRTPKAVLIEVCRLAELDAQGWCTATNPYLVSCLGGTERTMSRTLTLLEERGLLQSTGQGKARRLAPTPALRACYAGPDEAARYAALVAVGLASPSESATANLDKSGHQPRQNEPANLDKSGAEPRQNDEVDADQPRQKWQPNLDKSGHQPRQNGSRVIGDQDYQVKTSTLSSAACAAERERLEKKIAGLETENAQLKAKILKLVPPVAVPPQPTAPAVARPAKLAPSEAGPSFEEFWPAYGKKADTKKCRQKWASLSLAQRTAAMAALPAYVAATPERQFRKNPLTWLNGECWHDEPPAPRTRPGEPEPQPTRASTSARKPQPQEW